ncbi:carbon-phosphorus lyase complex accessory protein [Methanobrevibacter cuticularis]|uniref:Carbon-phosphorus lyase complex accessory protein n=1 Tax=Methanobrevibacter cuticularis TaxID=47311 RepID=A0A166DCA9_9EURY|nr:MBL fold metallo-hydrolase [Methanobrevibacter cuticularis]KZX15436.1 carbon-phosphorus lyase complex accessory protein [Methanobrevibacter cuticularis]
MVLSFYGGVNEIGGNKILVDNGNSSDSSKSNISSLFLDFGMSFSKAGDYFSEFLQPRKLNGVVDFIELGLLPKIKGIYREDYLKHCGINSYEEPSVDGVLLSHAHMDHCAYIHHLREDIPIYMRKESEIILRVLEETGKASFAEIMNLKKSFHYVPKKRGEGYKRLIGKECKVKRDIRTIDPYSPFEINGFEITSIPVDHSLPGSSAYFLENDNEAIVYSGDIRFHGRNKRDSDKFVQKSQKFNPTILLCEGTRINENSKGTEEDIESKAINLIKDHKGLAIVNYPIRDLDRLITFYNVAKNTDRILAINSKQAYMLKLLENEESIEKNKYPNLKDPNIVVYFPRKKQGLISGEHYVCYGDDWKIIGSADEEIKKEYEIWEREFLEEDNIITYKNLREEPAKYVFRCDFFELKELIDIKPENGLYIHSLTEPFNEEMEIDFKRVQNWLNHFNLLPIHPMHVSGHASGKEILDMIREINPEKLYPIHTENIGCFDILEDDGIEVIHPELKL